MKAHNAATCVWSPVVEMMDGTRFAGCFAELHCIPVEVLAAAADLLNGLAGGHECPAPTLMLLPSMSNFHLMENISGLFSLFSMLELKAEMVSGEV